jgi:hypothetical protein
MNTETVEHETLKLNKAGVFKIDAQNLTIDRCAAGAISVGNDARLGRGFAVAMSVGKDMRVGSGGGQFLSVGRDLTIQQGGGQIVNVGRDLNIRQGGGMVMSANTVNASNALVGFVLSGKTNFTEGSRAVFTTPQVLLIGLLTGSILALFRLFLNRR